MSRSSNSSRKTYSPNLAGFWGYDNDFDYSPRSQAVFNSQMSRLNSTLSPVNNDVFLTGPVRSRSPSRTSPRSQAAASIAQGNQYYAGAGGGPAYATIGTGGVLPTTGRSVRTGYNPFATVLTSPQAPTATVHAPSSSQARSFRVTKNPLETGIIIDEDMSRKIEILRDYIATNPSTEDVNKYGAISYIQGVGDGRGEVTLTMDLTYYLYNYLILRIRNEDIRMELFDILNELIKLGLNINNPYYKKIDGLGVPYNYVYSVSNENRQSLMEYLMSVNSPAARHVNKQDFIRIVQKCVQRRNPREIAIYDYIETNYEFDQYYKYITIFDFFNLILANKFPLGNIDNYFKLIMSNNTPIEISIFNYIINIKRNRLTSHFSQIFLQKILEYYYERKFFPITLYENILRSNDIKDFLIFWEFMENISKKPKNLDIKPFVSLEYQSMTANPKIIEIMKYAHKNASKIASGRKSYFSNDPVKMFFSEY